MNLSTVGQLLTDLAREHGGRTALVFPELNVRYSFSELESLATRVAINLYKRGLRKGDRLAVWANNTPEWIVLQFATAKIGVILLTVNTGLRRQELEYVLGQSESRAVALVRSVRGVNFMDELEAVRASLPLLEFVFILPDDIALLSEPSSDTLPALDLQPDDCINMQYTSGTTGFPKGVMLSHRNILKNGYDLGCVIDMNVNDSLCLIVPLFHCFGCVIGTFGCYTHAASIVALTGFEPRRTLEIIESQRCTIIYGVPTMFIAMLNLPDFERYDVRSLRAGIMAGAPCPKETMTAVVNKMGVRGMSVAYGLTEASPGVSASSPDDSIDVRVGTVGRALPDVEIRIVNPLTGEERATGQEGELITRGYHVMLGYYKKPEETARAIRDGWLWTGDLATMDAQGYVRITGRSKDLIIRGGENVAPREIEEVLLGHPAVREAYVYGVPSAFFGQQVAVAVALRDGATATADDLTSYCASRLAKFKVPEFVDFVTSFPTTPSGKIQKYKLTEEWVRRHA